MLLELFKHANRVLNPVKTPELNARPEAQLAYEDLQCVLFLLVFVDFGAAFAGFLAVAVVRSPVP